MAESFDTTAGFGEYLSHKRVKAAPIVRVVGQTLTLRLQGGTEVEIPAASGMFARYTPEPGDMYVVYDDGYAAISPRQVFDEGNSRIGTDDGGGLDFSAALLQLKAGRRVARRGWSGKGMWIALSGESAESRAIATINFWSPHARAFADSRGGSASVLPCIIMKTADDQILMGWLASQTDMLSRDWIVLDEPAETGSYGQPQDDPNAPPAPTEPETTGGPS